MSPQVQNEIITIYGDILIKKLVDKVNESKCFSVMADETTDVSVSEQLTICVRYLSGTGSNIEINEDFLKFYEISSLTGKDLASSILNGKHYNDYYSNMYMYIICIILISFIIILYK